MEIFELNILKKFKILQQTYLKHFKISYIVISLYQNIQNNYFIRHLKFKINDLTGKLIIIKQRFSNYTSINKLKQYI